MAPLTMILNHLRRGMSDEWMHRSIFVMLILVCVSGWALAAEPRFSKEQIERDLVLRMVLKSPDTFLTGGGLDVDVVLRNQSSDTAYPIVMPGGCLEPCVSFTALVDAGRGFTPASRLPAECGMYNSGWPQNARLLQPGEEVLFKEWVHHPARRFAFREAGRGTLTAHYSYRAGERPGYSFREPVTGLMENIPAFKLASNVVEFTVKKPLDLIVSLKKTLPVQEVAFLSEILDVRLVNRSQEPFEIISPSASSTPLRVGISGNCLLDVLQPTEKSDGTMSLQPGESVELLGKGGFANGYDWTLECGLPKEIELWVEYSALTPQGRISLLSDEVVIPAVKRVSPPESWLAALLSASYRYPLSERWIFAVQFAALGTLAWGVGRLLPRRGN